MNTKIFRVKSEMEVNRKYLDLLLIPKDKTKGYYSIMIEFKYLKKKDERLLKSQQNEAARQLLEYGEFEEIKNLEKLKKYTVIAINDEIYVNQID